MPALHAELQLALELAERCGALALRYHLGARAELAAAEKGGGEGLVTRADTEIDAALVAAIHESFPADAVLAEESVEDSDRNRRDRCWMIDPIDGTREFASRDPSWAIHIGLCVEGVPVLGVVAQPAAGQLSWGLTNGPDAGAYTREHSGAPRRLHASARRMGTLRLVSSKSHSSPRTERLLTSLRIAPEDHLRTGSTGVKISLIARAEADIYAHPTLGTKLWDTCAPQALLVAAGGRLTDLFGEPLRYTDAELQNLHGLLATNGAEHDDIVALLAETAREWFPD